MKKLMLMLLVLGLVAPVAMADFLSTESHSTQFGCGACHEAHNTVAQAAVTSQAPLWAMALPTGSGLVGYGATIRGGVTAGAPSGKSALCMGCHDGTSNGGFGHTGTEITGINAVQVDTALSHPVSIPYDTAQGNDAQLKTPANAIAGGVVKFADMSLDGGTAVTMECSSCHDVHGDAASTPKYMALRGGYTDSASAADLCKECHIR